MELHYETVGKEFTWKIEFLPPFPTNFRSLAYCFFSPYVCTDVPIKHGIGFISLICKGIQLALLLFIIG